MTFLIRSLFCSFPSTLLIVALASVSCRAPKPVVVEKAPVPAPVVAKIPEPELPVGGAMVPLPNDGIRMGNMLELPGDNEFRSTQPSAPGSTGKPGPVIARPPTDPPSRVPVQPE